MPGAGRGSETPAEEQQAGLRETGFEFDSFFVKSFQPAAIQLLCLADGSRVPGVGDREIQTIAARFFLVELREMMCEGRVEVKQDCHRIRTNEG
jgi:hypothetical protein